MSAGGHFERFLFSVFNSPDDLAIEFHLVGPDSVSVVINSIDRYSSRISQLCLR
jgi:hypothetical protein